MTRQEVFNRLCQHLLTQNAATPNKAYRSGELKSPIGFLIADKNYAPELEAGKFSGIEDVDHQLRDAISLTVAWEEGMKQIPPIDEDMGVLIMGLETMHNSNPPSSWKQRLKNYAMVFSLTAPEVLTRG